MSTEAVVQVAPDSSGKKIRNLQVSALQSDGSVATVVMQVVAIVDEDGLPVRVSDTRDVAQQVLDELRAVRIGMQCLVDWLHPAVSPVTVLPSVVSAKANIVPMLGSASEDNELIDIARDLRQDEDT